MAPYTFTKGTEIKTKIIPCLIRDNGTVAYYDCLPSVANTFSVAVEVDGENYALADCPDFKTADAFVKIIDSLLQSFK
jgi:hypothetical protein